MAEQDDVYGFDRPTCERIVRTVKRLEKAPRNSAVPDRGIPRGVTEGYYALTPSGGIPAATGTPSSLTPGSATLSLCARNSSGVITPTGESFTVYNTSMTAVGGNKLVILAWASGDLAVIFEDCT